VVIGANAAGKSNLADCLDFLGKVYSLGLEAAIKQKGGYENICYRKSRRATSPMYFSVVCDDIDFTMMDLLKKES